MMLMIEFVSEHFAVKGPANAFVSIVTNNISMTE